MSYELAVCPFCGEQVHFDHIVDASDLFHATCPKCIACGPLAVTTRGAMTLWNQRWVSHPLVLCLERCRAVLEHHEERSSADLYAMMSEAIRVLEAHRGCTTDDAYWDQVRNFKV